MDEKQRVAIEAGKKQEVLEFLDKTLKEGDHAWFVCSFVDCGHMIKGHCDVYTVSNPPKAKPGQPCDRYFRRVGGGDAEA